MPDTTMIAEQPVTVTDCDGYVVVSIWTPAKYTSTKYTYEHFARLPDAVAHHRAIGEGFVRDHVQHGIFPTLDGLPIGPPLDMQTILSVPVVAWRWPARSAPCTPENKSLAEKYIANGFAPAGKDQLITTLERSR
jgi:hypothetical protein